tara:strand:+ start:1674 stop:2021 length:348 start_codon:yes stop_codon:yes gene_type:complete
MDTMIRYTLFYALLFLSHIFFAANDMMILFRIVAIVITFMTFFAGLMFVFLEKDDSRFVDSYHHGFLFSIPLSIGLGWAYGDMGVTILMLIFPIISVVLHFVVRKSFIGHTYGLK